MDDRYPIVVDMDGTLYSNDSTIELVVSAVCQKPRKIPLLLFVLFRGKLAFKLRLAELCEVDPGKIYWNVPLIERLRLEKAKGTTIVLTTAAPLETARRLTKPLNLFEEIQASTEMINLKGARKADYLVNRFPEGFCYVGNSEADMPVWHYAKKAMVVGDRTLLRQVEKICLVVELFQPPKLKGWRRLFSGLIRKL